MRYDALQTNVAAELIVDNSQRLIIGGATFMDLQREVWTIKGNRNRALISIGLMVCQQVSSTSFSFHDRFHVQDLTTFNYVDDRNVRYSLIAT